MDEKAGNEYQGMELCSGGFAVKLLATQEIGEEDSFGPEYDEDADWPYSKTTYSIPQSVEDKLDQNGALTEDVSIGEPEDTVSAEIPSDVKLADGATSLTLKVESVEVPFEGVVTGVGETAKSVDVHIEGVAEDNTVPMTVTLRKLFDIGLNSTSVQIFHVEDGVAVEMTQVALADLDEHNEFYYDANSGDVVMCVASFSEYVTVEDDRNPWEGSAKTDWYDASKNEFTLISADQLAGLGVLVDEGNTFEGKTVKLGKDIDLGGTVSFNPIGFGYDYAGYNTNDAAGKVFKGIFDGQRHTISNLKVNGWDIGISYSNSGGGLFASVCDATIKNLTMRNANIVMECVEQGVIAGLAQGTCTFENIKIYGCSVANYQRATGGVVGEVSPKYNADGSVDETNSQIATFKDIVIDAETVVGSLWGDFDAPVGGVVGARWDDNNATKIMMDNVTVACRLDVYNDVTSTYQWYAYRRAGMLIGNTERVADDGRTAAADFLKCTGVTVYYGDWTDYHYCEFNNHNSSWPFVRVEAGENCNAFSNPRWGIPNDINGVKVTPERHSKQDYSIHQEGDDCYVELTFNQLYGGGQGVYGEDQHPGVTTVDYEYVVTYVNNSEALDTIYVTKDMLNGDGTFSTKNDAAADLALESMKAIVDGNYTFDYWMNAGSTRVDSIEAGHSGNVILYPSFVGLYTATIVDQSGKVLGWTTFTANGDGRENVVNKAASIVPPSLGEDMKFHGEWEVRYVVVNGNTETVVKKRLNDFTDNDFKNIKVDITLYPIYTYDGDVNLIPVDSDGDGVTNYYQVGGYSNANGQALVEIPASINGIPVLEVNGNAFSSYDGVHSIIIPADITSIGDNAFAEKWGTLDDGESITIYYAGSYAQWVEKEKTFGSNWESGISSSTKIFFLNGKDTVDVSQGYLQAKVSGWGTKTVSWNHNTTITNEIINEYTGRCNCSISTTGDTAHIYKDENGNVMEHNSEGTPVNANGEVIYFQDGGWFGNDKLTDGTNTYYRYRPDAAYWEGVAAN